MIQEKLMCAVCGMPIEEGDAMMQPYAPNGDWVHDDAEDGDGCRSRYWSAPGGDLDLREDGEWR